MKKCKKITSHFWLKEASIWYRFWTNKENAKTFVWESQKKCCNNYKLVLFFLANQKRSVQIFNGEFFFVISKFWAKQKVTDASKLILFGVVNAAPKVLFLRLICFFFKHERARWQSKHSLCHNVILWIEASIPPLNQRSDKKAKKLPCLVFFFLHLNAVQRKKAFFNWHKKIKTRHR